MIKRDEKGFICQHDLSNPSYMDGGDTACRTGIMSLCEAGQDSELMPKFFFKNTGFIGLVRHPFQGPKWNDPKETSRDQLVAYASGLWGKYTTLAKELRDFYSSGWINKDFLAPDVRNHLDLRAGGKGSWLGFQWLKMSILWSCKVKPNEEQNQIICMVIVAGGKYKEMYRKLHPDIKKNLMDYWGGWRDQKEIGEALYWKLME